MLSTLGQLATGYTATRYVAEFRAGDPARAGRIIATLALVSGGMGVVVAAGLFFGAPWVASTVLEQPGLSTGLRIAAVALFFTVINGFAMGALAGLEGYAALGRASFVSGVSYVLLTILGGRLGQVEGAMTGVTISAVLQCILTWRAVASVAKQQAVPIRFGFHDADVHILTKFAVPAALNGFVSVPAIWFGNAVLVRQEGGFPEMALFTAANSFRTIALFIPSIVNNVNFSLLSHQLGVPGGGGYVRVFWVNLTVTVAIAVGGAVAASISGPWLLGWFGEEFKAGYPVLLVLMISTVPQSIALALLQIIQSRARIWFTFYGMSIPSFGVLALFAALLTPSHGALGLAWAYLASAVVTVTANGLMVTRLGIRPTTGERVG